MNGRPALAAMMACALSACGGSGSDSAQGVQPPPNVAPVAQPDNARTRPGVAVDVAVLANDTDAEGGVLTIVPPATVNSATVAVQPDNRLRVTPAPGFGGTLEFQYQVQDREGARSAFTTVRVEVAPAVRAMLGIRTAAGTPSRVVISGLMAGDTAPLLERSCPTGAFAMSAGDMRTLVGVDCGTTPSRRSLVVMRPRESLLAAPLPLLTDAGLVPGFAMDPTGATVTVIEKVTNVDEPAMPGDYELVRIDVATRTVTSRLALPGVERISAARGIGAGRLLFMTGDVGPWPFFTPGDLHVADAEAGTVTHIGAGDEGPVALDVVHVSADGRYVLFQDAWGVLVGYALAEPAQRLTFWDFQARGRTVIELAVAPAANGSTFLALTRDLATQATAIWELPLTDPDAARPLRDCPIQWAGPPAIQVRGPGRFLAICDAATSGHTEVVEIDLATNAMVPWTPAGGVPGLVQAQRAGDDGLLLAFDEPAASGVRRRIAYVRTPGTLDWVAPDLDLTGSLLGLADRGGTAFALTHVAGDVMTPYIVDVNLLAQPFEVREGIADGEQASALMVFSPLEE